MLELNEIKSKIKELAERRGLSLVALFGSQVSGKTHAESDFDVSYLSDRKVDFEEEVAINAELVEIFKNNNVQLVNIKMASPLLLKKIMENCLVFYEKEKHLFDELFIYAIRIYDEARPIFALREHYILHKLKKYD